MFLLKSSKLVVLRALPKSYDTMKLAIMHNENTITFSRLCVILSLKKSDIDFKLVQLLIWLSLVNIEHLDSSTSDMTKNIMLEKLNLEIKTECAQGKARR